MSQRVSIFLVVLLLMFNGEILGQPKSSFSIPFSGRVTIKKTPNLFKPTFSLPQVLKYEDSTGFNECANSFFLYQQSGVYLPKRIATG